MELALFVYLAGIVGKLSGLFIAIACLSGCIFVMCGLTLMLDGNKNYKKPMYINLFALLFSAIVATLLPSEKTMYLMAGAYTTQAVVQSNVGKKTVDLIEQKLDEELAKLKEKK